MNSEAIQHALSKGSECWKRWENFDPKLAPSALGVYVYRIAGGIAIERAKGASDIAYVSCSNIRQRLIDHGKPREDFQDAGWLVSLVARERKLEVTWFSNYQRTHPATP
jgi:hypothetical protein